MKIKELSVVKISATAAAKYDLGEAVGVVTNVNSEKGVRTFLVTWYIGGKNYTDVLPIKNDGWYWMFEHELEYVGELYNCLNAFAHPSTNTVTVSANKTISEKHKKASNDTTTVTNKTTLPPIVVIPKAKSTSTNTVVATPQQISQPAAVPSTFAGKNLLATGVFKFFDRNTIIESIKSVGANYASGVSKSLDVLIVGDKPGPNKIDKAKLLGIPMISEKEYMKKIGILV